MAQKNDHGFSIHGVMSGVQSQKKTSIYGEVIAMPTGQIVGQLHENTLGILTLDKFSHEGGIVDFVARSFRTGIDFFFENLSMNKDGSWTGKFRSVSLRNDKNHIHGLITCTITPMPGEIVSALRYKYSNKTAMVA